MKISIGFPQTWGKFNCIVSETATKIWEWGVQTFSFFNIAYLGQREAERQQDCWNKTDQVWELLLNISQA